MFTLLSIFFSSAVPFAAVSGDDFFKVALFWGPRESSLKKKKQQTFIIIF